MKYIVVTGGVLSGLGKGITASSIGLLLKRSGYKVTAVKIDPYLNVDAGTMNPFEHGEVFVLDDGGELDLDLGNYERFLDISLTSDHNITTGKVYKAVIDRERKGDFLGKTVQIVPHIVDEIRNTITSVAKKAKADVCIVELGGTVGDIESMPFIEGLRQLYMKEGKENVMFVHTTLVPIMGVVGEQKTKPTQHSVKELNSLGIRPSMIVCRGSEPFVKQTKQKIALFCDVPEEAVFSAHDMDNVYQVPLLFEKQGIAQYVQKRLGMKEKKADMKSWKKFVDKIMKAKEPVDIALVGKYSRLKDSYLSHIKAFDHAGAEVGAKVNLVWTDAPEKGTKTFKKDVKNLYKELSTVHGILIPGGFGVRGTEGKILAAGYARENGIPYLGVCLGLQMATIEFARSVLKYKDANSTEFDKKSKHPVVCLLPEQSKVKYKGATMRLGSMPCLVKKGTLAYKLYKDKKIHERHRHRYEINPEYIDELEKAGLIFSGRSPDGIKMEIGEIPSHPFFIAVQYHPEFKSRPTKPAPLYYGLVDAAVKYKKRTSKGRKK
jgi:CTP synthase